MTDAPARGLEERPWDTRARLENDVGPRVATSGAPGGVPLVRPRRVRAWPEADEPRGRTLMRDGRRLGRPHAADWPA